MDALPPLRPRRPSHRLLAPLLALLAVAGALVGLGAWRSDPAPVAAPTTTTTAAPTTTTIPYEVPPVQRLATPVGGNDIPTFDAPNGAQVGSFGHWYGYLQTSPILEDRDGFVRIRLPERPNQATAWVRATDVVESTSPWRIVINVTTTKVHVYKDGFTAFVMPGGMGKASTPTPLGSYYVAVVERDVPGYGPVVLDLSAHSEAIQSWQGSGDAIIALHGPISAASAAKVGTEGTHISNGCIRLHTEDQLKLDPIPVGTPVDIVA